MKFIITLQQECITIIDTEAVKSMPMVIPKVSNALMHCTLLESPSAFFYWHRQPLVVAQAMTSLESQSNGSTDIQEYIIIKPPPSPQHVHTIVVTLMMTHNITCTIVYTNDGSGDTTHSSLNKVAEIVRQILFNENYSTLCLIHLSVFFMVQLTISEKSILLLYKRRYISDSNES